MIDIFSYEFMRRAFIAGSIISIIAPLTGSFLVLRRLSQIGDTLSHVALAGVAAGILLGINPTLGSIIVVLLASFGIEKLRKTYFRYSEISIAIVMSAGMAVAIILLSLSRGGAANIMNYLFGSIVSVTNTDVLLISTLGIVVVASIILLYKELLYITFDEEAAKNFRYTCKLYQFLLYSTSSFNCRPRHENCRCTFSIFTNGNTGCRKFKNRQKL